MSTCCLIQDLSLTVVQEGIHTEKAAQEVAESNEGTPPRFHPRRPLYPQSAPYGPLQAGDDRGRL